MPFDAADAVEPMDYDFTKFKAGKGTVPEPSQSEYRTYVRGLTSLQGKYKDLEKLTDKDDLSDKQVKEINDKAEALSDEMDELVAKLCQNVPSREDIAKLPFRVKNVFSKWLQEEFNPKN